MRLNKCLCLLLLAFLVTDISPQPLKGGTVGVGQVVMVQLEA